ncbi:hypothetical protein [Shewanella halotolerans]|uniref:PD-(D/E)XK nuclease domain-containing protein n=1 Tax=Shewanella halotolerans TaxID=2864204 RepID=UPI001C654D30|nr:hypothetical protein [Shewanella halotolerans]QYJ89868.1 hypothetical protein K0H81_19250 [Shewanella halotolerans]
MGGILANKRWPYSGEFMRILEKVDKLIEKGQAVLASHRPNPPGVIGFPTCDSGIFATWKTQSLSLLERQFSSTSAYYLEFQDKVKQPYTGSISTGIGVLTAVKEEIESGDVSTVTDTKNPIQVIENLCDRFHLVARQLRERHDERDTIDIQDEYDVQDLFHALLHVDFEDIRPEDWVPSNAGKSTRVDFLLKPEGIVVEIKKTRKGLGAKEIGSQLIEDIHRYSSHPDCDALVCFVYDPDGRVANPRGLEADLNKDSDELVVKTFIRP